MYTSPSLRATARLLFIRYLHLPASRHRQEPSSTSSVRDGCDICSKMLRAHLTVVFLCHRVFHRSCVEDVLRYARYIASSGRVAIDCVMCGAPATVPLLPTFHHVSHVSDDRPIPRQVRAVRAEDGAGGDDVDGPLDTWHMFARRQDVAHVRTRRSAVVLSLQEDVAQLAYPPFIPHRGWVDWVCLFRPMTVAQIQHSFFGYSPGTRAPSLGGGPRASTTP